MINQTNKAGYTSLHLATCTQGGHTPVVDVLLSHGADINFLNSDGQSCLHLAAEHCNKTNAKVEMTSSLTQVNTLHALCCYYSSFNHGSIPCTTTHLMAFNILHLIRGYCFKTQRREKKLQCMYIMSGDTVSVLNDTLERFGKKGTMSKGRLYKLANMCYTASRCHWTSIYAQYNGQVVVNLTKCLRILLYITYTLKSW